mgnify:CR=1 FL=1
MYKFTDETTINDFSEKNIEAFYNKGYKFVRKDKGIMQQTHSLRIILDKNFKFNSENRRILRKTEWLKLETYRLPLNKSEYNYEIHKLGKNFYETKAGKDIFSAAKIKELITKSEKSNFNLLLEYSDLIPIDIAKTLSCESEENSKENFVLGYSICYKSKNILHYSYPFYNLEYSKPNIGMGMILKAIEWSLHNNLKYFYIGSVDSKKSLYKLQFENMEWWDNDNWSKDITKLKELIRDF